MPSAVKRSSSHIEEAIIPGEFTKLILCFDGTGNTFSGTNADTNVVKILRKLDRNNNKQFHYYQTGIGTYDADETSIHKTPLGELKSKISKTIDQGFGTTFDAHIMAGYRFLMRYYEPDAKIYIFGFSRGAYTAKYLSRMVNKVGLLCKGNEEMVPFAYRLYARALQCESEDRIAAQKGKVWGMGVPEEPAKPEPPKPQSAVPERAPLLNGNGQANRTANGAPNGAHDYSDDTSDSDSEESSEHTPPGAESESDSEEEEDKTTFMAGDRRIRTRTKTVIAKREVKAFSRTFCRNEGTDPRKHKNIKVFFLGMWDCVNSVAVVEKSAPAPVEVTGTAKHVRHAVAVDERRVKFKPALLAQDIRTVVKEAKEKKAAMHTNGTPCKQGTKPKKEKTEEELAAEAEENKEDIREVWFPGNHGDIGGGWPAVPGLEPPASMGWGKRLWYIFKTMKPADVTGGLKNNDLQMSDMALDWMIREVTLVGDEDPRCQVHWCHTLEKFTKAMDNKKKVEKDVVKGFMHDTLSFGYGSSFLKVFMWKFMEMLPGIPRWELNDKAVNEADKGWESYRFKPNFGSYRDIPRRAILHNSLKERLKEPLNADGLRYRPQNNHGHGKPCLIVGETETAPMKVAENQNQKPLDQYDPKKEKKEKAWAERHQLWQLDNQ